MTRFFAMALVMLITAACSSTEPKESGTDMATAASSEQVDEAAMSAALTGEKEHEPGCHYEKSIGTRIGRRVCRTPSQKRAEQEAGREAVDRYAHELDEDRKVSGN